MKRPDPEQVTLEAAYAEALAEIARLQERVILGRALINSLRSKGVGDGQANVGVGRDENRDDTSQYFSD